MVIYFTGTGNSRHLARIAARDLDDEITDAFEYIKSGKPAEFHSEKPWVFVCPVYGWQIPHVFSKFIRENSFRGNREAYFIIDCGSDIGCAGEKVELLCKEKGFHYKGAAEVWMPENYIALFKAPDEAEAEKIINEADIHMEQLVDYIISEESFPELKTNFLDKCKSGFVNTFFYKFIIKAKAFYATDKCISCGLCEKICMLNNIILAGGKPKWGDNCTHCMACICGCPEKAIEYGSGTKSKRRYYLK